ncbi:DUF397 domain-containing protein [Streptomyces sp. NPDC058657]|uniref:DUF397 domain-containing protein n=1 Tax=unclassified Streptomyces TaxID=2593676 RepID=UPI00366168DD
MPELKWLKSSFSEASGNACVEVATTPHGTLALRESEQPAAVLVTRQDSFGALVRGVKAGGIRPPRP